MRLIDMAGKLNNSGMAEMWSDLCVSNVVIFEIIFFQVQSRELKGRKKPYAELTCRSCLFVVFSTELKLAARSLSRRS